MKSLKKILTAAAALSVIFSCTASMEAAGGNTVYIIVNTKNDRKPVSPYIYGVSSELMDNDVSVTSVRAGGNRFSAYNWENNSSNAGSDWQHMSDGYFQQLLPDELDNIPGGVAVNLSQKCAEKGNLYSIMTLQMAGYVSADFLGTVNEEETAPSSRWNRVEFEKGTAFDDMPDLNDGVVYMDEFVNYLVKTLGNSQSEKGIKAYSLDNEPALWSSTHPRIHPNHTECREIIEKSKALASAVKKVDPHVEIFGPALFGYGAYTNFSGAPDWDIVSQNKDYRWFIDYYLDEMKKAEDETGIRLLDVLDIHFYTEARGACRTRYCNHYTDKDCVKAIVNSTRSLWDSGYKEDSWITETGAEFFPLLPNLQQSIDKYYPNTKLAITEYNFGGSGDICGSIAQADALGLFAKYGVYDANLFAGDADYQCAAINLYTNYNGKGEGFGDTLVYCESDNVELSTAYAAIDGDNDDVITLVLTNKSFDEKTAANIKIEGGDCKNVNIYSIDSASAEVIDITESSIFSVSDNTVSYEMNPKTVSLLVISKDKAPLSQESLPVQDEESGDTFSFFYVILIFAVVVITAICIIAALAIKRKK